MISVVIMRSCEPRFTPPEESTVQLQAPVTLDVDAWVRRAVQLYPDIEDIGLVGSRAFGQETPYSDVDLVICLFEESYIGDDPFATEKQIAFGPVGKEPGLDLFFLRPDGEIARWEDDPDSPEVRGLPEGDLYAWHVRNGIPFGDFNRLREDLRRVRVLYSAADGFTPYPGKATAP
jgi:predicted nucleotidyltransferase